MLCIDEKKGKVFFFLYMLYNDTVKNNYVHLSDTRARMFMYEDNNYLLAQILYNVAMSFSTYILLFSTMSKYNLVIVKDKKKISKKEERFNKKIYVM